MADVAVGLSLIVVSLLTIATTLLVVAVSPSSTAKEPE